MNPLHSVARHPRFAALAGALFITFSGIFYRWSEVSPSTGVVFRCLYGLPLLALAAWVERRELGPMSARAVRLSAFAGVFFAADLLTFHYVVDNIGAGLATMMGNLQVVIVALAAWVLWGERPGRNVVVALPIMLFGVVLISGLIGGDAYGVNAPLGVAIGLVTAASYAGYLLVIRRATPDRRAAGPVTVATAVTALVAAIFGTIVGDFDPVPSLPAHAYLLASGRHEPVARLPDDPDLAAEAAGRPDVRDPVDPAGHDRPVRRAPARRGAVDRPDRGRDACRGRSRAGDRRDRPRPRRPARDLRPGRLARRPSAEARLGDDVVAPLVGVPGGRIGRPLVARAGRRGACRRRG